MSSNKILKNFHYGYIGDVQVVLWYGSVHPSIRLCVILLSVHLSIHLAGCLSICLSLYTYVCLSICLYVWLAVLLYICTSVCWSISFITLQKVSGNGCILFKFVLFPKGSRVLQCFNALFYWIRTLVSSNKICKMSSFFFLQSYRGCAIVIYFPGLPRCLHQHLQVALRDVYKAYIVW